MRRVPPALKSKQDHQAALEETLSTLSPEEGTAAMLQAALKMKDRSEQGTRQKNGQGVNGLFLG